MTIPDIFDQAGMVIRLLNSYLLAWLIGMLLIGAAQAAEEFPQEIEGDIGLGGYFTRSIVRDKGDELSVLPYLDFEYGRLFARVDTLGIKTQKLGYGYLELVGRISQDGFDTNVPGLQGLGKRETSTPLGIGTLQVTPAGGFWINAFHDVNRSRGNLFEVIYGGEFKLAQVTFYPLLGAEFQTGAYVRYYYGISAQEAANSKYALYQPAGSFNDFIGLIADFKLSDEYHLNCYVRRKQLGDAIQHSPIVSKKYQDTGYIALSFRFK
jgi:outer membrane protein